MSTPLYTKIYQLIHVYPYGKSLLLRFEDADTMAAYVKRARAESPEHYIEFYVSLQPQEPRRDIHLVEAILDITDQSVNLFNVHEGHAFVGSPHSGDAYLRLNPGSLTNENVIKYWREVDTINTANLYARAHFIPLKYPNILFYMFLGDDLNDSFRITKDIVQNLEYMHTHLGRCSEEGSFEPYKRAMGEFFGSADVSLYSWGMYSILHRYYASKDAAILGRMRNDSMKYTQYFHNSTMIEYSSFEQMEGKYFDWVEQNWPGSLPDHQIEQNKPEPAESSNEAPGNPVLTMPIQVTLTANVT